MLVRRLVYQSGITKYYVYVKTFHYTVLLGLQKRFFPNLLQYQVELKEIANGAHLYVGIVLQRI